MPDIQRLPGTRLQLRSAAVALLLSTLAMAPAGRAAWTGGVDGGTDVRNGFSTFRLRGTLDENSRPFTQRLEADIIHGSGYGTAIGVGWRPRYWFADRYYAFGNALARRDDGLDIDRQLRGVLGVGANLINTPETFFEIEVGAGYVNTVRDSRFIIEDSNQPLALVRANGHRALFDRLRVDGGFDVERRTTATEWRVDAGISFGLAAGAVRYGVQMRGIEPDEGESQTETDTFVSFGYRF